MNSPIEMSFEVWYDLPSLRKEAVIQLAFQFEEDDGGTFSRTASIQVGP